MGSGRDKRKKAKGPKPGVGAIKTERKTEKNEEKATRRLQRQAEGGEDDIDALLAQFKLEDDRAVKVTIQDDCPPPSARVYSSFLPLPNNSEIILFGGEWLDSEKDKMYTYADIYILNVDKMKWRKVTSPKGPPPRTSHQAVIAKGYMWVFGGEFTSLNQEKFRHYGDFWRLNLTEWTWEQLPSKGGPSARSGHRIALFKNRILLFGGFHDNGKDTKYFNDLWSFSIEDLKWTPLGPAVGHASPSPRGGCQLALHTESNTLFLFGGYSVHKYDENHIQGAAPIIKKKKGDDEDLGKGVIHEDAWALDLKTHLWERVKKQGMAPGPRTSFGLVTHKQRCVLFGGVYDREGGADRMYSELFNEGYQFNFVSRRWFPLAIRPSKAAQEAHRKVVEEADKAKAEAGLQEQKEEDQPLPPGVSPEMHAAVKRLAADKNSALYKAAVKIQANYRGHVVRKAYQTYKLGGQISELLYSPATYGIDLSAKDMIKPRARSAPLMCVVKNTLWLLGGVVEIAHTDIVLDDLWSLELNKLDGWNCVKENTVGDEAFKDDLESDSDEMEKSGWETD